MPEDAIQPQFDARKEATVPMWVVVYAIRYGITRQSYARGDALRLAQQFWDDLDDATQRDVREVESGN
jgi:hypothetical protein